MIYLTYPLSGASEYVKDNQESIYISKALFQSQETDKTTSRNYVDYAIFISAEYKDVFIDIDPEIAEYCNKMVGSDRIFTVIIPHVSMYAEWKQRAKNTGNHIIYSHIVDFFASEIYLIDSETFYLPKIKITDRTTKLKDLF